MARKRKNTNTQMEETFCMNEATLLDYYYRFRKLATSIFEWVNLPPSMEAHYIEECLYYKGQCAFLFSNKYGYINTNCASGGYVNIYGLPTNLSCYSYDFQENRKTYMGFENDKYTKEKSAILVKNTNERVPTINTLNLFAKRLANTDRTIDVNINLQKTPYIILCDEKEKLSMINLMNMVENNETKIFGNKQIANIEPKTLNLNAPYLVDKLEIYKKTLWNEALTFLGINNIMEEKKERLVTDEANANNELINLNLQSYLAPRQEACNQFNKLFELTGDKAISVRVRSDLRNVIKNAMSVVNDFKEYEEIENIEVKGEEKIG